MSGPSTYNRAPVTTRPWSDLRLSLEARFHAIDTFLLQWQWIWREVPFKQPTLSWFERHPQWKSALDAIDDAQLQDLTTDVESLYAFARDQLQIDIAPDFYRIDVMAAPALTTGQSQPDGVAIRKWQQIQAFAAAVHGSTAAQIVEWCAGKGHLSRTLLQQNLCNSAIGLEWNTALIKSGMAMAKRGNIALLLKQQNVLDESVENYCTSGSHHIALHACGNLHVSMLRHCGAAQVDRIDLVPCCYHKIDEDAYQTLSSPARQSALKLDDEALKLALQETVTAPATARRTRERLQRYRLGFDALQRTLRDTDSYLPVPSMAGSMANSSFIDFCRHSAALKQLELPAKLDYDCFETIGAARFRQVSRYDLLRQLFRRPIELWLALDRCLFLAEQGYDVRLAAFCSRELTPRNLWIHASLQGPSDNAQH